jgi:hypothetical protein
VLQVLGRVEDVGLVLDAVGEAARERLGGRRGDVLELLLADLVGSR